MDYIQEMRLREENLKHTNDILNQLEKIEWQTALKLLIDGEKIFKVEKIDERYAVVMYRFREDRYEHEFGRKTEVRYIREISRQKAYSNGQFDRLSDSAMGILEFASHDWYKENSDIGVGRFS